MRVSYAYIQAFVAQLDALNKQAGKTIVTEAKKRDIERKLSDSTLEFEDVYSIMASVCPTYAKLASALTCRFYDGIRQASDVPDDFRAEAFDTVSKQQIKEAARSIYADVKSGMNTVPLNKLIGDSVAGFVRQASNNTVYRNAAKDPQKPRYAIVPSPSACVFCQLIAANGYEYPSEQSAARHERSFHNHCNCQATQVYGNDTIAGYDPKKYEDAYDEAAKRYRTGEISDDLQQRIDEAHRRHDERNRKLKEQGIKGDPWRERNAVLMVWREMEKE